MDNLFDLDVKVPGYFLRKGGDTIEYMRERRARKADRELGLTQPISKREERYNACECRNAFICIKASVMIRNGCKVYRQGIFRAFNRVAI